MSDLKIDYADLRSLVDEGPGDGGGDGGRRPVRPAWRVFRWVTGGVLVAVLPFAVLVRLGVFAYHEWGWGTWPALSAGVGATALLMALYAWAVARRVGAGRGTRRVLARAGAAVAVAYAAYALVYLASENAKSAEVRAEYTSLHPLLRLAASTVTLVDREAVLTDAARTAEDYYLMGLSVNEASLHFRQDDGFVHALDLRTRGRPEWRNRGVELYFWVMGFHSRRHVGTADHLHVSLRLPG